ncbi:hypothetical protein PI124_g19645 [Phytophthora idaei]|nr:hypothetical protein PI124_g19645 [Phytophthora idaei]
MNPTQASHTDDREFPRLNGRNFIIWKTRVAAALEDKNLLGFVERIDYTGDFDSDFDSDEKLNPALSDMNDMSAALDAAGAPKTDEMADSSPSESSSDANSASSEPATAGDDGDVDMGQENLPTIQSFTAHKRNELKRTEKLKAKSQRLSSKKLRLNEAKAFLIKTIDDQHFLMVKDKTTAFEIFQTICSNYRNGNHNGNRKNKSRKFQNRNKFHGRRKDNDSDNEYGIIAITTLDLSKETEAMSLTVKTLVTARL